MKRKIVPVLILVILLSLCGCRRVDNTTITTDSPDSMESTEPKVSEYILTDVQRMVADTVNELIQSETFADWEMLYEVFTADDASHDPKVTNVTRYEVEDFEGVAVDYYLIAVKGDIGHWINEEIQQGSLEEQVFLVLDPKTGIFYDSITTDALNGQHDVATEKGRALYLLWTYGVAQSGLPCNEYYLNDTEIKTEMTETDLEAINASLVKK